MDCIRFGGWFVDGCGAVGTDASGSVDTVGAGDSVDLMGHGKPTKDNDDGEHDAIHDRKSPAHWTPTMCPWSGMSKVNRGSLRRAAVVIVVADSCCGDYWKWGWTYELSLLDRNQSGCPDLILARSGRRSSRPSSPPRRRLRCCRGFGCDRLRFFAGYPTPPPEADLFCQTGSPLGVAGRDQRMFTRQVPSGAILFDTQSVASRYMPSEHLAAPATFEADDKIAVN
jgi:hypothetical protein